MATIDRNNLKAGDEVFVIYNNPHVPSVSNIRPAEIVQHPHNPNEVALFLNETFHVIEDDDALFTSQEAAEEAYQELVDDNSFF
ncbi:transcriptional regulator SplA domain-containing protein [Peribacillus deserti]|uniref:Transcriptional regulator n=1 Tax=Peribacillus deserti TaxID=673318 RepID=A0A2N5LZY1_9BACI|nr:transcriptional regulator SplA domain-containing protein [Peribacillus deserti]PLT27651.1 transcriptional regulator [Peribacillus deserti]